VMLVTTTGERPLANFSGSDYRAQTKIVDEINTFLQTRSQPTLEAARGGRWNLLFGLPFLLVGVGMVAASFQANSTTWTFDRTQGTITHQRGTLAGPRVDAYAMHDIAQVHLNESSDSDGDSTYRIELWTHTGQRIPMTKVYTSGYKNKERAIEIIRAFLRA